MQERHNSSALAMELRLSWTKPLIYMHLCHGIFPRECYEKDMPYMKNLSLTITWYHATCWHNDPIFARPYMGWMKVLLHDSLNRTATSITLIQAVFYLKFFEHPSFGQVAHEIYPSEWKVHSSEISITIMYCWYMFLMAAATDLTYATILI